MSEQIEFREIESDADASFLMPGNDGGLHIVLFCEAGAPAVRKARELAPELEIPDEWDFVLLDPSRANETARRFGVDETSGMAVVGEGSLLAIEHECSLEAFRRLIEVAEKQSRALTDLG